MDRTYEKALEIIDSRKRVRRPNAACSSRASLLPNLPVGSGTSGLRGMPSLVGMAEWLQPVGHSADDINALNIIHVAGTKGKGSTCAFAESFLRAHGRRTGYPAKTGLYTSPHLICPEERIRLDGRTIDRERFARYFFEIFDRLPQLHSPYDSSLPVVQRGPRNLQLYALLAFHTFIREKVDMVVLETHSGGEYDATNVVERPLVTAITTLGMDHVVTLGPGMENIAWHKAGIFKSGAVALSTVQADDTDRTVEGVLHGRAEAKGQVVRFVAEDERLPTGARQLQPRVQRKNASLGLAAAEAWLEARGKPRELSANDVQAAVEQWSWPGRFKVVHDAGISGCTWYLDAAHNEMSVAIAAQWFAAETAAASAMPTSSLESGEGSARILIFSHINELRDSVALLASLATALRDCQAEIGHVIFTKYATIKPGEDKADWRPSLEAEKLHATWQKCQPGTRIWDESSIGAAVARARDIVKFSTCSAGQVLVTGSQHLVGPVLEILQS
ncbi:hypothetical protein LTR91_014753 [Friedmanniomyces endolithicus]|uniref:tetrahydrofolate synthase n=1 Tax=Friedmanniomyces endolithicus TaxID=329885 RepID=A0AAN6KBP2_9PEZI|nr:hypothetical protein LTR94_006314 [Friedmanniomyces endolithicus]KAK0804124.1 hypothetical protein LTR38_005908 [Friedmanniomyces endolithicus]KAK0811063.1 hypothetical protein LTR59_002074 [Friedmanniomyces endolithicus]KAK0853008.1 hypothetical protein LTR03_003155 [Friedmanniomyces endolithicus]KAK0883251.1 hypothetical protein LTR87_002992 [Friedmanniomyces endolithicus]